MNENFHDSSEQNIRCLDEPADQAFREIKK